MLVAGAGLVGISLSVSLRFTWKVTSTFGSGPGFWADATFRRTWMYVYKMSTRNTQPALLLRSTIKLVSSLPDLRRNRSIEDYPSLFYSQIRLDQTSFITAFLITNSVRMVLTMRIGNRKAKSFAQSTTFSSFSLNKSALAFQVACQRPMALSGQPRRI